MDGVTLLDDPNQSLYKCYHGAHQESFARYQGKTEFPRPKNVSLSKDTADWDRLCEAGETFYRLDGGRSGNGKHERYPEFLAPILEIRHKGTSENGPKGAIVPKGYMLRKMIEWTWKHDEFMRERADCPVKLLASKAQLCWDTYVKKRDDERDEAKDRQTWPEFWLTADRQWPLSKMAARGEFVEKDAEGSWHYYYDVPKEEQDDKRMYWIKYPYELIPLLHEDHKRKGTPHRLPRTEWRDEGLVGYDVLNHPKRSWF